MQAANQLLFESTLPQHKISAGDLSTLIDRYSEKISVLSLDCFDTLLWRNCANPKDVFFSLQQRPLYQKLGITAQLRIQAEKKARQLHYVKHQSTEITLRDIYLQTSHDLTSDQLNELIEEELAVEMQVCYAFEPTVELLRSAQQRGLKIIIVSDIYYNESQLRRLLSHILPQDAYTAIQTVFCSCDHGLSKGNGLFNNVLKSLQLPAQSILHIGDNVSADFVAPRMLNLNAQHFIQIDDYVTTHERLRAIVTNILYPQTHVTKPLPNPFRHIFALLNRQIDKPETSIGYLSLGPIMYAFAQFLLAEIRKMQNEGKNPKILFLLRDAYLPARACEALLGEKLGTHVRISRFSAFAASFRSEDDIDNYLADVLQSQRFDIILKQLLLPPKVAEPILKVVQHSIHPVPEFLRLIRRKDIVRIIVTKSSEYRSRLLRHLDKEIGLKPGDNLVFIDLGYSGTVQRQLAPIFSDIQITLTGKYLIALPVPGWKKNRSGLLDASCCDHKLLNTFVSYIALLEQLCTTHEKSVIDYDKNGNAIFAETTLLDQQQNKASIIQDECIRFIHDAKKHDNKSENELPEQLLHENAASELGRMIFFPTQPELDYLQSFRFETNLGTNDTHDMFDAKKGLSGLRRRGVFYSEKNSKSMRMLYPAELRSAGFELVMTLLAQHRFNLDIKLNDLLLRNENINAILRRGHEVHQTKLTSIATHDGYFAVWTPVGKGDIQLSLQIGELYEWIQIESAELIKIDAFMAQAETGHTLNAMECLAFSHMTEHGSGLYSCLNTNSNITMQATMQLPPVEHIFRLVFRPIIQQNRR